MLLAGGEKAGDRETLVAIRAAVKAGGAGVCVGRNAFQRDNPRSFVEALCKVVNDEVDPDEALKGCR